VLAVADALELACSASHADGCGIGRADDTLCSPRSVLRNEAASSVCVTVQFVRDAKLQVR
jgi:hypothetical protein